MPIPLQGVLPIIQTPFSHNDQICEGTLRREIDWAFSMGADGIGSGMVAEILRLTYSERLRLAELMTEFAMGRGSVFAAVGAESTLQAIEYSRAAEKAGCDAVMAVPPLTTKLSPDRMIAYFSSIADAVSIPVIVQDASGYVGQSIPIAVCSSLLEAYDENKILFKPEGSPIGPNLSALRDATGGRARIFEGSGGILLIDSFRRGITGTMPGMDLLDGIAALWKALKAGDDERAYSIWYPVCGLVALQLQAGLDGFLAIEKHLLVRRGIFPSERRRQPNSWELDEETRKEVDRLFDRMQLALK
ncbi:MAG: dihydrodipicolinate synthase family protein [Planctomycetaceae bacterium]